MLKLPAFELTGPLPAPISFSAAEKASAEDDSLILSCGLLGPDILGSTSDISNSNTSEKTGSGVSGVHHMPWAFA